MRKLGYFAETVEHRLGRFIRKDLFDFADVIAFKAGEPPILIQAYHAKEEKNHAHLNAEVPAIKAWLQAGGSRFEHHQWSFHTVKGRKYWSLKRIEVML